MRVAIGITTYNRKYFVDIHAQSLCCARLPADTDIIVVDDCSTEFDAPYLKSIYPQNADIRRRSQNSGGASLAIRDLMIQLLEKNTDAMLLLDSDLIVATDFIEAGIEMLHESDGILSLFNTPNHAAIGSRDRLVLKKTVGCAATLWRRDVALEMLSHVGPGPLFDWRFCDYLLNAGYEICVVKNSRVQHAGFADGENSRLDGKGDFGLGFDDSDAVNAYRTAELILHYMQSMAKENKNRADRLQNDIDSLRNADIQSLLERVDALEARLGAVQIQTGELEVSGNELAKRVDDLAKRMDDIESLPGVSLLHRARKFVGRLHS